MPLGVYFQIERGIIGTHRKIPAMKTANFGATAESPGGPERVCVERDGKLAANAMIVAADEAQRISNCCILPMHGEIGWTQT